MYRCALTSLSPHDSSVSPCCSSRSAARVGTLIRDLLLRVNLYGIPRGTAVYPSTDWTHQIPWVLLAINTIGVFVATDLMRHRLASPRSQRSHAFTARHGVPRRIDVLFGPLRRFSRTLAPHHRRVSFGGRRGHPERPFCGHARIRSTSASSMTLFVISIAGAVGCVVALQLRVPRATKSPDESTVGHGRGERARYRHRRLRRVSTGSDWRREYSSAIVLTGFCGGLTTFSSALAVPVILQREHHWGYAAALITTTPLLCSGMFVLGMSLAH